ncbi:hypothetical protein ABMC89_13475 [Sulfitobacter sp. HNIBRBA3233]|uniref:hypothetical protein n=1 Tax=Sulfitobacter marinivivus TaxID=3158558 RepID=UPI0032DF7C8C
MRGRKRLSASERRNNLAIGIVGMIIAALVAQHGEFEFSLVVAFIIGAFAAGGIFRGVFGFDQV